MEYTAHFEVISTEKVPFTYRVAGLGARFLAWMVDMAILAMLFVAGLLIAVVLEAAAHLSRSGREGVGMAVFFLWEFALVWGYFLVFEWLWHGQTPGKRVVGIRVIQWQGTSVSFYQAAVRNVVRFVDGLPLWGPLPICYGLGFATAANNRYQLRLGDWAAGTLVVQVERHARAVQALYEEAVQTVAREGLMRQRLGQLSRAQKQTLLDLCLRRDQLRISDRAQLFHAVASYCKTELDLVPGEHESDEKFVVSLAAILGSSLAGR